MHGYAVAKNFRRDRIHTEVKSRTFLPDETRPSRATGRGGGSCHRGCGRGGRAWAGGAEWVAAPAVVTSVTTSSRAVTDPALSGWTSVPGRTRRDEISRGFSVSRPTGPPADSIPSLRQRPAQDGLLPGEMEGPETPRGQGRGVGAPRAAGAVTGLSLEACCGLRDGVCCNILPTVQANMGLAPLFLLPFHPNVSGARDCSEHKWHLLSPSLLVNIARLVSLTT